MDNLRRAVENLGKIPLKIGIIGNDSYRGTLRAQIEELQKNKETDIELVDAEELKNEELEEAPIILSKNYENRPIWLEPVKPCKGKNSKCDVCYEKQIVKRRKKNKNKKTHRRK